MVTRKYYAVVFVHLREYHFRSSIKAVSRLTGVNYRGLLRHFRAYNYYANSGVEVYRLEDSEGSGSEG